VSGVDWNECGSIGYAPVDKHNRCTMYPWSMRDRIVGVKNIASSSGCAVISRADAEVDMVGRLNHF